MIVSNSKYSPPPITTPITVSATDLFGVAFQNRDVPGGNMESSWAQWFQAQFARSVLGPRFVSVAQADLTKLAAFLGVYDAAVAANFTQATGNVTLGAAPLLAHVTDYNHILQWTGAAWQWGPGELGSGQLQLFEVDPTGVGWHLYDGSANVPYLKADGTLGTKTLPDLTSAANLAAYLKGGSPNAGPNAATAPTFNGILMGTHQHTLPVGLHGGNLAISTAATGGTYTSAAEVGSTAAGNSFTGLLSQAVSAGTPQGTITNDGEPRNLVRRAWFRQ